MINIRETIKQALHMLTETKKDENKTYDFGCTMAYLTPSKHLWERVQNEIDKDDVFTEEDLGLEPFSSAHVTLLYGIHSDVPDEDVEAIIETIEAPEVTFEKISMFENEKFDVLKYTVSGKGLNEANKKFKELPHTNNYPTYEAHCTIGYLKKGTAKKYCKDLEKPFTVKADKIVYSKPDGTKKEYPFGNKK